MTAKIHHFDLYGTRQHKYQTLLDSDLESMDWQELSPNAPFYLFMPQEQAYREEYEAGWGVNEIFAVNGWGIATRKDYLLIDFRRKDLTAKFKDIQKLSLDEAIFKYAIRTSPHWSFAQAKGKITNVEETVSEILFRPFDIRYVFYERAMIERGDHRYPLMRNMMKPNLALITARRVETKAVFDHIFCTNALSVLHSVSMKEGNFVFPLWLYPTDQEAAMGMEREANLNPQFVADVKERIGETPTPEGIFHYAYAVFHAPTYRTRYAAFLKTDFPRLPLPPDAGTFQALAALGAKLVALHLLEAPGLQKHGITYPKSGDHVVKKMRVADRYAPPTGDAPGRVRVNDAEYFENVPPEAWEFRVGGYQPAAKWLDDRAGRALTEEDITHYRRMIAAMRETAALLPQVDAAFLPLLTPAAPDDANSQSES